MLTLMIKNHTGVQQQNIQSIQSVQQRSIQSVQSVQQQSIKNNALCTVVMRMYHISTP